MLTPRVTLTLNSWEQIKRRGLYNRPLFATFLQGFVIEQNAGIACSCLCKPRFPRETVSGHL